jgi:hypothetical protein
LSIRPRHRSRSAHAGARGSLPRVPVAAASACGLALALAACGGGRPQPSNLTRPARPDGFRTLAYPAGSVSLAVPRNWLARSGHAPLIAIAVSGDAVVALWRYPAAGTASGATGTATAGAPSTGTAATAGTPTTGAGATAGTPTTGTTATPASAGAATPLSLEETALVNAVKAHGGLVRLVSARTTTAAGRPAVVLDALERIGGRIRRVISTHVYAPGAELVLEEYAPPAQFPSVRRQAFARIARSLRLLPGAAT